jgi:DNA-binding transcriptional MerR regulator
METLDPNAYLTLEELCAEVTRLGRCHRLVAKGDEISGRTVRFYIEKELLPSVRSGPGKKYPYDTVWKVLFIRLLSKEHELPLNYLRETMQSVDAETMRRVVMGEEPLEVRATPDVEAVKRHKARGYQVVALTGESKHGVNSGDWRVLAQTKDVVLQVRDGVAPGRLTQLRHIAALIRALDADE